MKEKMKKGKVIYLSGVTSTGKTSIARMIQDTANGKELLSLF
jgi:chloramphenicol 3-O-phosphotransferase